MADEKRAECGEREAGGLDGKGEDALQNSSKPGEEGNRKEDVLDEGATSEHDENGTSHRERAKKVNGQENGIGDAASEEELRRENSELTSDLKRLQAEFDNYQKRTERERTATIERGKGTVLLKLIALADEFEAAMGHMQRSSESELRSGIRLLHNKLITALEEEGVVQMECLGKQFDPDRCDAVEVVESEEAEGIVAKELRRGYVYGGKVLRHAMVGVTKKPVGAGKEEKKTDA